MSERPNTALVLVAGLAAGSVVAAEWMRRPGWILALGVVLAGLAAALSARRDAGGRVPRLLAWAGAVTTLVLGLSQLIATRAVDRVQRHWPQERERLVTGASRILGSELDAAVLLARGLADRAVAAQGLTPAESFDLLAELDPGEGPSHGVALFDRPGRVRAWAGIQRAHLSPAGPELSAVTTPFYLWLVARRQTSAGTAAAAVLLARADDVPRAGDALTDRFTERTGVGLRFLPARTAPADSDVFDYVRPGPGGGDTLFAVQPVPPEQDVVAANRMREARRLSALLLLVTLGAALAIALRTGTAALLLAAGAAFAVIGRAPWRLTFPASDWLWSASYTQRLLGPFSATAGALLLSGVVVFIVAGALWRRGITPSLPGRLLAVAGTLLAPYALQRLARGIAPSLSGVALGQWIIWQVALVVAASALVLLAAALVRGSTVPAQVGRGPFIAAAMAIGAALLGLWLWHPVGAWPEWYPYLWAPALLLSLRPMPSRATLATIAVVAGSSAALLTWGAVIEGRMALARNDVEGLGAQVEPVTLAQLDSLVHQVPADLAPRGAGDLFLLWRRSGFGAASHPASLGVWSRAGQREIGLDLADLAVPAEVVRQIAHEADSLGLAIVRPVVRVPGLHGVGAVPLRDGRILTVTVGPRSQLVAPSRLARFLLGAAADPEPPYDVALAPPAALTAVPQAGIAWRRAGWTVTGERSIVLPDGTRHAHATIDLRGAAPIMQRGLLLLVLDVAVLALLWLFIELAAGRALPALRRWWPRAHRSLRLRLAVSLALFFVVPTIAIALWSLGRLEDEFRGARELLLQRTLRDAVGGLALDTALQLEWMAQAARRVDAELLLAEDGAVTTASAPVLTDLGLVDLLVPGEVYRGLVWEDELEHAADQRATPTPTLVGFRLLSRSEGGRSVILAAPELLSDRSLRRREADLALAVLVAAVAGVLAALVLAGIAARALAEPLQQLRRAALAVGAGERPVIVPGSVPVELEPIGGALEQAAAQVEAGQRAQRVLAWGEMARQVAHEIKNPLTPIRLGVQHLLRLFQERPAELESALPQTGERILAEIDRLDGIARAFSRFALPSGEGVPLEVVDLAAVVRDVVQLYRVGGGATRWEAEDGAGRAMARRDELVEVLVNLCENARDAGAQRVVIAARPDGTSMLLEVRDDGRGISPEALPHIFEPRFSTNTSGSGLGLAIARRLVESWGGTIAVTPQTVGTTVRLTLRPAP